MSPRGWPIGRTYSRASNGTWLAPRHLEALFWRQHGLANRQVAVAMGTSVKTAERYTSLTVDALGISARGLDLLLVRGGEIKRRA